MRRLAIVVALLVFTAADAAEVAVVDPDGKPATRATAVCIDPASADPLIVTGGKVTLTGPCKRLRCDAAGVLPGEVDLEGPSPRCVLRAATVVLGELPAAVAASGLEARLLAAGKPAAPVAKVAIPKAAVGKPSARFTLPPVKPGRYTLELSRGNDGWVCRADLGPLGSGRRVVAAGWREPATFGVRVKGADGKPVAGVPVRAWSPRPFPGAAGDAGIPPGAWSCASSVAASPATDATGLARLSLDHAGESLVVAGDFKSARGLAFATLDRVPAEPVLLTLAAPVVVRAKVEDEKDRPVACDVSLIDLPQDVLWLTKVAGGSTLKSVCDPQGAIALGPVPSASFSLEVRPRVGMPLRVLVDAPAAGSTADLGVLRVRNGESVRVVVQDESGNPVSGAKVQVRGSAGIVLTVAGTTAEDGGVDLAGFPRNALVTLDVTAKGFLPAHDTGRELDASPFVVKLSRGASISGSVRDADGLPVEGASVAVNGDQREWRKAEVTDARGAFAFDGVGDGAWRLTAKAAGYAASEPAAVEIRERKSVDGVTIKLVPAEGISGRVVDAAGTAVAGARVRLVGSWQRDDLDRASPMAESTSASDGTFQLLAAAPADSWLLATKSGLGPGAVRAPDPALHDDVVLTLTEPAGLIVHLPRGAKTSRMLRVRDGSGLGRTVTPGGATELTFTDLAPGRGAVGLVGGADKDVTLVARESVDVTLDAASAVEGRVTFEGAPAPRVVVSAVAEQNGGGLKSRGGTFTDERGRYRLDGLSGDSYRITAVGEDGRAETTIDLADGETAHVDLTLRVVRLIVSVIDGATAKPVSGVSLQATPAGKHCNSSMGTTSWGDPGELGFELSVGSYGCMTSRTDAAGVARLGLAAPGSYDLGIGDDLYEPWTQPVALTEGTTTKRVALTRKPDKSGDKPHVIANIRTDPPGLSGTVECRWGNNTSSSSPVSGRYDCGEMAPGPGEVAFHVEGYGRGRTTFAVPASGEIEVDVDVPRGGTIYVPVSQESAAQPVLMDASGFAWSDVAGQGRIAATLEDVPSAGRAWVFRDVPPGTYVVTVGGKARPPVPLSSGGTAFAN